MAEEFKDFTQVPTLTLEPQLIPDSPEAEAPAPEVPEEETPKAEAPAAAAAAVAMAPAEEQKEEAPKPAEPELTPEEQKMVDDFAETIDVENTNQIMQYGAGTQKKMADFSDAALENVKTQDLGEVGNLITGVVGELKNFDAKEEKGLFGFFKKEANKLETLKTRYDKAETNVEKIADALTQHQVRLMKDSAVLDQMYAQNLAYFKELTMYILAGKKKLESVRNGKLQELKDKALETGLAEDAQAAKDLDDKCLRFEKKIHDLELTRTIAMQTAPQIRLIQNNDTTMVEKIQTTLVNTIPLWKSQMVLALGIEHSAEAARAQREVTDVTNALLKKNAETLHMASVETARESERGIVDFETLQQTNAQLIQTLDDVLKIQEEGREKRRSAEIEMAKMESDLKSKLLEIRK
ncbi:MAG: toxic anion resistance protein [Blautia sp.]|nr:toxic anion resistance protein [Blautia sp.]